LSQSLQLKLDNLILIFGLVPNKLIAQEFVKLGSFRINGLTITNYNYIITLHDVLQVNMANSQDLRALFSERY
jgi:hypothetical protein